MSHIRGQPDPNQQYDTIMKGLQSGHRIGYDANKKTFVELKGKKAGQNVITDLDKLSTEINKFITENKKNFNPNQITKLKEAFENRAKSLETRQTHSFKKLFISAETKGKMTASAGKLKSLGQKVQSAYHTHTPETQSPSSLKIPPTSQKKQDTTYSKEEVSDDEYKQAPSSSTQVQTFQETTRSESFQETTAFQPEESFEGGPPPPPPPPPGAGRTPPEKRLQGEEEPPKFDRAKLKGLSQEEIKRQQVEIREYIGLTFKGDVAQHDPNAGLNQILTELQKTIETHKDLEEQISESKSHLETLQRKLRPASENLEKLTQYETDIKEKRKEDKDGIKLGKKEVPIFGDHFIDSLPDNVKKYFNLDNGNKLSVALETQKKLVATYKKEIEDLERTIRELEQEKKRMETSQYRGLAFDEIPAILTKKRSTANLWLSAYNNRSKFLKGETSPKTVSNADQNIEGWLTLYPGLAHAVNFKRGFEENPQRYMGLRVRDMEQRFEQINTVQ